MVNYAYIEDCSMLAGDGLSVVFWTVGCNHRCIGCQNIELWSDTAGTSFTPEVEQEFYDKINHDYISNVCFCGGSPLYEKNRPLIKYLVEEVHERFPDKTITLYTGYTWEEIQEMPDAKAIVDQVDILVDGRFVLYLKDNNLEWRGSSNQRVIDVKKTLDKGEIVLYN